MPKGLGIEGLILRVLYPTHGSPLPHVRQVIHSRRLYDNAPTVTGGSMSDLAQQYDAAQELWAEQLDRLKSSILRGKQEAAALQSRRDTLQSRRKPARRPPMDRALRDAIGAL